MGRRAGALLFLLAAAGCLGPTGPTMRSPRSAPPAPADAPPGGVFQLPLQGARVISPYGRRGRKWHTGVDLKNSRRGGDPVLASRAGKVDMIRSGGGYGHMILLRHEDGYYTRYA